jgi:Ser-tRNA(Ala) deacylase AlaX
MTSDPAVLRYLYDDALEGTAEVVEVIAAERKVVRLRETWFHPQGGGQKADRGTIGAATVVHVACNGLFVDHVVDDLSGIEPSGRFPFTVDAGWRRLNAAYHTAGHLIGAVVEAYGGLRAVAGHQWPGEARVEFEGPEGDLQRLKADLQTDIENALRTCSKVTAEAGANGRAIRIGLWPPIPCGGTHVRDLSEIGPIDIGAVRRKGPRTRVSYSLRGAD